MSSFSLQSSEFTKGSPIPKRFGYKNDNQSPPLEINQIPPKTKSLALIMDDPDAQEAVGKIWVHWVLWNIEPTLKIAEAATLPESSSGTNDFGDMGYGGPAPPDKQHTYVFKLYALDKKLELPKGSTSAELQEAMQGSILDKCTLTGTFMPDN